MSVVSLHCERNTRANVTADVCLNCGVALALMFRNVR